VKKFNLPSKICPICKRPFKWRKKWKIVWNDVTYCSRKCRGIKQKRRSISANKLADYTFD
tara:strand:- start:72 stop:251 length:180 start_codon:yes stop_codon:yes gene_type:complete